MRNNIPLIVSSCDKCSDLWHPFFWLLKKYWMGFDRKVYLCTDSRTFGYEGMDIECPLRMPLGSTWSENLIELLNQIDDEFVFFMLDDFWLKSVVNLESLDRCEEIMKNDPTVGFICLIHQLKPSADNPVSTKYPFLIEYGKKTAYRVTTQAGLWRRDYLLSLLRGHESAWWFEMFGSKRSRRLKYHSFAVSESIFDYDDGGVLFRGSFVKEYIDHFRKDEHVVLDGRRRIAEKSLLISEVGETGFWQKLNPCYLFHYIISQF